MNVRAGTIVILCALAAVSVGNTANCNTDSSTFQLQVGDFKAYIVPDGDLIFPQNPFVTFDVAARRSYQALFQSAEPYHLPQRAVLLETGNERILIDTGIANVPDFGNAGKLINNLKSIGVSPESIDKVLITHGHADHVGGLASPDGGRAFPNATVFISRKEYDFWLQDVQTVQKVLVNLPPANVGK